MDITDLIPESYNDFGAILFWIIIIILIITTVVMYLYIRRMKKKVIKMQKDLDTHVTTAKQSKEKRMQELSDVKKKVDKIIEDEKK